LQKLYNQYQSKGLIFYRITSKETPETIKHFMEKESLNVPVLIDKTGRTERLFGVWVHPTTYLINRQALVCYRTMGPIDWTNPQATSIIDHLLKER
jgi:peroxiredoxin